MTNFKYQEEFAQDLAAAWIVGNHEAVRNTIRALKNKAQASYIAAAVCKLLCQQADDYFSAGRFVHFMHPNN